MVGSKIGVRGSGYGDPLGSARANGIAFLLIALLSIVMLYCNWVGFIASDDDLYLSAALKWVEDFPGHGDSHWGIRYTLVLPIALLVSLFGSSEAVLGLPSLIYFYGSALCVFWIVRRHFSVTVALFCLFLFVMTPLFVVTASIANIDQAEFFFAMLALIAFEEAIERDGQLGWLFLAGVFAGLATISRLTSLGLVLFFAVYFLKGAHFSRWRYWMIAAGFFLILGGDALFHAIVAGEPFQRIVVPLSTHASVDRILSAGDYTTGTGNLSDNRFLAPILAVLVNQEFGLTYLLFFPAAWFCLRNRGFDARQRRLLNHLVVLAVIWFLWIGYSHTVRPLPRYFSLSTAAAVIVIGVWLWSLVRDRRTLLAGVLVAALVGLNVLFMLVENKSPRFPARILAEVAASHDEPIYTDQETARRARTFLGWKGAQAQARVHGGEAPPAGTLYLYVAGRDAAGGTAPGPDWQQLERHEDPRFIRTVLDILGAQAWLPESIYRRVAWPNAPVVLYRAS